MQSRLDYRALVIEGSDGNRVALVKSDSYLAQDLLTRRAAQILADGPSGIGYGQLVLMATHDHSSPYRTTPAAGVWAFQDVMDLRAFEYHARQIAAAVEAAAADLRPARMGATTVQHRIYKGNIARPPPPTTARPPATPTTTPTSGCRSCASTTSRAPNPVRWPCSPTSASTPSRTTPTT